MQTLIRDIRYSLRHLIHNPGLAATALLSLSLGIGATTAVFSVLYAALINPYPYPSADRIVRMSVRTKRGTLQPVNLNDPQIREIRKVPAIESVLAMDYRAMTLTGHDLPENVDVVGLIANGFTDLGLPPALGRGLSPSDAVEGREPELVTLLSYKFWRTRLLSDPQIVGKTVQLDHKSYTVVGVAAPRFIWYNADIYVPMKLAQEPAHICVVDLLLRPGVTRRSIDAQLQPLLEQFAREFPKRFPEHFRVEVEDLNAWVVRGISGTLYLVFGAVSLLLAIGCANVSILLLARGTARQHEFAVRTALGASSGRLMRQLLTESMTLAGVGVVLGVVASYGILAWIRTVLPRYAFAPEVVVTPNLAVLFFSGALAVLTAVLFGLWPAVQSSRAQAGASMVGSARRVAGSIRSRRTHNTLIAGQIALTLVLLAGAGSAIDGFSRMLHVPLGYDPHHVMSVGIPLRENAYTTWAGRAAYFEQLRARVAETPGVALAAISSNATPPRNGWHSRFEILGRPAVEEQRASINMISPEYFAVLHIPVIEGRIWTDAESHSAARVAVINRALAQRYFPHGGAIGHSVKLPEWEDRPPTLLLAPDMAGSWLPIIGVVGDARNEGLVDAVAPAIYVPYSLNMAMGTQILVRSAGPPLALLRAVRSQLTTVDPDQQSYGNVEDLESWISDLPEWQRQRLATSIFAVFGGFALILAAVGLYSVVSYTVAQRTNEFGIRMALGARRSHLLRIVLASTVPSVCAGIAAGVALSVALNRTLQGWAQADLRDPLILIAGAALVVAVSGMASAAPAWHASSVDPMTALRCE